jgi:hypothetical protein
MRTRFLVGVFMWTVAATANGTAAPVQTTNVVETRASAQTVAGAAKKGFALSLVPVQSDYSLGQPIIVTLEIRNVSGSTVHMLLSSRNLAYDFNVVDTATGKSAPRRSSSSQQDPLGGPSKGLALLAGQSKFVRIQLDDLYAIPVTGTYQVTVAKAMLLIAEPTLQTEYVGPSNTVTIHVSK